MFLFNGLAHFFIIAHTHLIVFLTSLHFFCIFPFDKRSLIFAYYTFTYPWPYRPTYFLVLLPTSPIKPASSSCCNHNTSTSVIRSTTTCILKAFSLGTTAIDTRDNSRMAPLMEKARNTMPMETCMLVIGSTTTCVVKASLPGPTAIDMSVDIHKCLVIINLMMKSTSIHDRRNEWTFTGTIQG